MGWASGSALLDDVARAVMPLVPEGKRAKLAGKLIDIFEGADCDTIDEVEQPDIQREYDKRNPPDEDY